MELGACVIEDLPANLPVNTPIEVTIRYDEQARVHVSARELASGKEARVSIVRLENVVSQTLPDIPEPSNPPTPVSAQTIKVRGPKDKEKEKPKPVASVFRPASNVTPAGTMVDTVQPMADSASRTERIMTPPPSPLKPVGVRRPAEPVKDRPAPSDANRIDSQPPKKAPPAPESKRPAAPPAAVSKPLAPGKTPPKPAAPKSPSSPAGRVLERAERPIPLCNQCGEPLQRGQCPACARNPSGKKPTPAKPPPRSRSRSRAKTSSGRSSNSSWGWGRGLDCHRRPNDAAVGTVLDRVDRADAAWPDTRADKWIYVSRNLQVDKSIDELDQLMQRGAAAGYTKMLLADSKFSRLGDVIDRYFDNVEKVKQLSVKHGIEVVPTIFSIGYSNDLLHHNPNLAEALPVRGVPLVVGRAELRRSTRQTVRLCPAERCRTSSSGRVTMTAWSPITAQPGSSRTEAMPG